MGRIGAIVVSQTIEFGVPDENFILEATSCTVCAHKAGVSLAALLVLDELVHYGVLECVSVVLLH